MNNLPKTLSYLLCLFSLMQVVGCSAPADDAMKSVTEAGTTAYLTEESGTDEIDDGSKGFIVSKVKEELPDSDFAGRNFTILVNDPNEQVWTYTNMVVEEEIGEILIDSYYRRNRIIEDKLNINIKQVTTTLSNAQNTFKISVEAGDFSFDCALLRYNDATRLASGNYCIELNSVPFMDFSKPWWDKNSLRDLSVENKNYLVASDISICDNDNTWLIYFDKKMVEDYNLEVPYDLANSGRWTFGKMLEMMRATKVDLDSNGKMNINDQFGLLTHGENYAAMWIGADTKIVSKDKDDIPYLTINNERFFTVWSEIIEIMNDDSCKTDDIPFISRGLADGKTLFGTEILKFVRDYRSNERDFGIIIIPKLDETQEDYHTYVALSAPMLIIPRHNADLETTGIILEAMTAEGHRTILPAYYEVSINNKYVRDEESIEMLNIAFRTRTYDLGVVFNWAAVNDDLKNSQGPRNDPNITSFIEKKGEKIQLEIEKTIDSFRENPD